MEDKKDKDSEIFDKIKVFSSTDDKLKILGELLSNKSSRDIIRLLIEKEMYANEIAKKLELRPNLVIHHLKKMESIELLEIIDRKITRKGKDHRFFRIPKGMLIIPNEIDEENGFLKKFFKDGIKFVLVGFAGIVSWYFSSMINMEDKWSNAYQTQQEDFLTPISIGLIAIIVGLSTYIILKKKKD